MADFTEITITEDEVEYTCPVYIKQSAMACFGKIISHDGNNGVMLLVDRSEGFEKLTIIQYPNSVFPSVGTSESSDETEFNTERDGVEAILAAY